MLHKIFLNSQRVGGQRQRMRLGNGGWRVLGAKATREKKQEKLRTKIIQTRKNDRSTETTGFTMLNQMFLNLFLCAFLDNKGFHFLEECYRF